jgi:hypothetical protein
MSTIDSKDLSIPYIDLIQSYLDKYGWVYEMIDPDTIVTGFSIEERAFTMFIGCIDDVLFFSVPNFVNSPSEKCVLKSYQFLLEANLHLICGKFALDENGKIGLFAEFPISVVSYDFFSFILYSFGKNANEQLNYVPDVTQNPNFKSPYHQPEP